MSDTNLSPELSPHERQNIEKENKPMIVMDLIIIMHLIKKRINDHTLTVIFKHTLRKINKSKREKLT